MRIIPNWMLSEQQGFVIMAHVLWGLEESEWTIPELIKKMIKDQR